MNQRFTLIVVLGFVALAVFAWTQRDTESRQVGGGAPTATPEPLLALDPADIEEVSVVGQEGRYELARISGGWEVDGAPASDEVDGVVMRLADPTVVRDLPADRDPGDYGFASQTMTVTLRTAAGDAYVIDVGDETPVDFNVYIRLGTTTTATGTGTVEEEGAGAGAVTVGRMVIVGNSDFGRLKDWLTEPPLAPTPTPQPTETPEPEDTEATGTPEADAEAEEIETPDTTGDE